MKQLYIIVIAMLLGTLNLHSEVIQVGTGTQTSITYPFYYSNGWWGSIYKADEISHSGDIHSIGFQIDLFSGNWNTWNNQKIYLAHVSNDTLPNTSYLNVDTLSLVYTGSVEFLNDKWIVIGLDSVFNYNGTDNLLLFWENRNNSYESYTYFQSTPSPGSTIEHWGATFPTTDGIKSDNRPNIKLNFASQYDAEALEWVIPTTNGDLNSTENVQIRFMNMGYDTIKNIDLKYSIDGGNTFVTETYPIAIPPFEDAYHLFTTQADMSVEGVYNCVAVVSLAGDVINTNDTVYAQIEHQIEGSRCSDPIVLNGPIDNFMSITSLYGNNYAYNSLYCAANYVQTEDVMFEFTLEEESWVTLYVATDRFIRPAMQILTNCPESGGTCVGISTTTGMDYSRLTRKQLSAGTYKMILSAFGYWGWTTFAFDMDFSYTQITDFLTFDVANQVSTEIDYENHVINNVVMKGSDLTTLKPIFTNNPGAKVYVGDSLQYSDSTIVDFTNSVTYVVTNADSSTVQEWTVTITITDNEAPTGMDLTDSIISENSSTNTLIGRFVPQDDIAGEYEYTLIAGTGDDDNTNFSISGDSLLSNNVFDFETKNTYKIRVQVLEDGLYTFVDTFDIYIKNLNEAPTSLSLSNNIIQEAQPAHEFVGTFSAEDPEGGDFTYEFSAGTGDVNNSEFIISNDTLYTNAIFDFETSPVKQIRVTVKDTGLLGYSNSYVISLININEPPHSIALSSHTIQENNLMYTLVGSLSATDPENDPIDFYLVGGEGDSGNNKFDIMGTNLVARTIFDYETQQVYSIRIGAYDSNGLNSVLIDTIYVTNKNESPDSILISNNTVLENQPTGTFIGKLSANDPDGDTQFIYYIQNSNDYNMVSLIGDSLFTSTSYDYEQKDSLILNMYVYDQNWESYYQDLIIYIENENEIPYAPTLSNVYIDEGLSANTFIGKLSSSDPDGDIVTFNLVNIGEVNSDSLFIIRNDSLFSNVTFNYSESSTAVFFVSYTDDGGLGDTAYFTIYINDVYENLPPTGIEMIGNGIVENNFAGDLVAWFSPIDETTGTYVYELTDGNGANDNSMFYITGNTLYAATSFNFEDISAYTIHVTLTENENPGSPVSETFTINILDAFEYPESIELTTNSIASGVTPNSLIAEFIAYGPDNSYSLDYYLTPGIGDNDNYQFYINGNGLYNYESFDYNIQNNFSIHISAYHNSTIVYDEAYSLHLYNGTGTGSSFTDIVSLYPNPATNDLYFTISNSYSGVYNLTIVSPSGKIEGLEKFTKNDHIHKEILNISNLTPGAYILKIQSATNIKTLRFTKY